MKYYVYKLIDSSTNLPFYIGKGCGDRMYSHVRTAKRGKIINGNNYKLTSKINHLLQNNIPILYESVFQTDDEKVALDFEIQLISEIGIKNLCNLSLGGDFFGKLTPESEQRRREKISKALTGKPLSEEHKQTLSKRFSGINHPGYGSKRTEETKKLLSLQKMGDKNPAKRPEVRAKTSATLMGRYGGTKNPSAKLTESQVREIRSLAGNNQHQLAIRFGVSQRTINKIVNGKSYVDFL